jgi:NADH:quinone reductase (non-electrogenic)
MSIHAVRPHIDRKAHIVVIGGGYAGVLAANRLRRDPDVEVTVVNPRRAFVERIRLHQMVAESGSATLDLAGMLDSGVRLMVDTAVQIDADRRAVRLGSGGVLSYDYLIYAVGSTGAVPVAVPGARQFAYPIGELEQAERLQGAIGRLPSHAPILVVGGGLTGIEVAGELAEQRPDLKVTLLCGGVLAPSVGGPARRSVRRQLSRLGVEVLDDAVVAELGCDHAWLTDGRVLASAVTVWTAGFGVPDLATLSGLTTDGLGRLVTDATLTSVDDIRIVAAGDAAAPAGQPLRMSCQAAMPLGATAADTVLDRIAGANPKPIDQGFVVQNISIGRRGATVQFTHRDDSPRRSYVGGRVAALIKEAVCKNTVRSIVRESQKPGAYRWPRSGAPVDAKEVVA